MADAGVVMHPAGLYCGWFARPGKYLRDVNGEPAGLFTEFRPDISSFLQAIDDPALLPLEAVPDEDRTDATRIVVDRKHYDWDPVTHRARKVDVISGEIKATAEPVADVTGRRLGRPKRVK